MPTILESTPMPAPVDEHPTVRRHVQQLKDLEEKLTRTQASRSALVAERTQLQQAQHEANVAAVLDGAVGVPDDPDRPARLAQIENDIERASTEEAAVRDALERLTVIAAGVREQVEAERRSQIGMRIRATIEEMVPDVQRLLQLNVELFDLAAQAPGALVPPAMLLHAWLEAAQGVAGDRR